MSPSWLVSIIQALRSSGPVPNLTAPVPGVAPAEQFDGEQRPLRHRSHDIGPIGTRTVHARAINQVEQLVEQLPLRIV